LDEAADVADHLDSDHVNIVLGGGSSLVANNNSFSPDALLHGGEHFDDERRTVRISHRILGVVLHREILCDAMEQMGLRHPTPNTWTGTTPASAMR
jgi:hypothetical protein